MDLASVFGADGNGFAGIASEDVWRAKIESGLNLGGSFSDTTHACSEF